MYSSVKNSFLSAVEEKGITYHIGDCVLVQSKDTYSYIAQIGMVLGGTKASIIMSNPFKVFLLSLKFSANGFGDDGKQIF